MTKIAALLVLAGSVTAANAQTWAEQGEAGDLPSTANITDGAGPLLSITGGLGASDVDMARALYAKYIGQ